MLEDLALSDSPAPLLEDDPRPTTNRMIASHTRPPINAATTPTRIVIQMLMD